ncbi:DUF4062 domain-containing protein [Solibacillus sp. FSL H8-0538]|uniref:DUF4062 domain-containing protein n=1 Tax=Solibacillus sp. FSL H8-0538 TaxID=2921400 RepID=UPI0030FB916C
MLSTTKNQMNIEEIKKARTIKVFISSTFRDMQAERDELIKHIFVKLRRECEKRGIIWSEVDLRWGVTHEQKSEGQVLPICLAEIDNCLPFFIGILGERYGWIPEIEEELIREYPWLSEHRNKSVTEIEILHGALLHNNSYAMFYFRDPSYIDTIEESERANYSEKLDQTITSHEELVSRQQKLVALKETIRNNDYQLRENFGDAKELGQLVYEDMRAVIDKWFPLNEEPNPLHKEINEHEHFAKMRAKFFIGRKTYLEKMTQYCLMQRRKPLVIHGPSGVGKTSLLAAWYDENHLLLKQQGVYTIAHFIGVSPQSTDSLFIMKRIITELNEAFSLNIEIPSTYAELSVKFDFALEQAANKGKLLIMLDSIDQLVLTDKLQGDKPLWLPELVPSNICFIVSTTDQSKAFEMFKEYDWLKLGLDPLSVAEQEEMILMYLGMYSKGLDRKALGHILRHPLAVNPLFLMTLLEEIRLDGRENIIETIRHYMESETIEQLFMKKLERLENDYNKERPNLVQDTLSLLWSARNGLLESELKSLLGDIDPLTGEKVPLSSAIWSPFYLAMESNLVNNGGLICLFHNYLRDAVQIRYLQKKANLKRYHGEIANHFAEENIYESNRALYELPWQYIKTANWKKLYDLCADLSFVEVLWEKERDLLQMCWTAIEIHTNPQRKAFEEHLTMLKAYAQLIEHPEQFDVEDIRRVVKLLETSYMEQRLSLIQYLHNYFKDELDPEGQLDSLDALANLFKERSDNKDALELFRNLYDLSIQYELPYYKQSSLGGQASIYLKWGQTEKAMDLLQQQELVCTEHNELEGLQKCIAEQARVQIILLNYEKAMDLQRRAEKICYEIGSQYGLQEILSIKGTIYRIQNYESEALECYKEQERICTQLGYQIGRVNSLLNQLRILEQTSNQYSKRDVNSMLLRAEIISRKISNADYMQQVYLQKAKFNFKWKQYQPAKLYLKEQIEICRRLKLMDFLQQGLGIKATILGKLSESDEALEVLQEQIEICEKYNYLMGLQYALNNRADILMRKGKFFEAVSCIDRQIAICKEMSNDRGLIYAYKVKADQLRHLGKNGEAIQFLLEMNELAKQFRSWYKYDQALYELARISMLENQFEQAIEYFAQRKSQPKQGMLLENYERLLMICNKRINGLEVEHDTKYVDYYTISDIEFSILEIVAKQPKIQKPELIQQLNDKGIEYSSLDIEKTEVIKVLQNKTLIVHDARNKKGYYITDLGAYRLLQITGVKYDIVEPLKKGHVDRDFNYYSEKLRDYLITLDESSPYQVGDSIFVMEVNGEEREIYFVCNETLDMFPQFLDEQLENGDEIYYIVNIKAYLYSTANVEFYKWLKGRFGKIQNARGSVKVFINFASNYQGVEQIEDEWQELVY